MARAKCYHTMDAFVKLVVVLVRYSGDPTNTVTKVNLLNKVGGAPLGHLEVFEICHIESALISCT